MMGQMATALNRGSPTNHMLFTQPPTSGLQAPANPSTVFLLTSSAPEAVTFSQTVQSPTFLTQMPAQVTYGPSTAPLSAASALSCVLAASSPTLVFINVAKQRLLCRQTCYSNAQMHA